MIRNATFILVFRVFPHVAHRGRWFVEVAWPVLLGSAISDRGPAVKFVVYEWCCNISTSETAPTLRTSAPHRKNRTEAL